MNLPYHLTDDLLDDEAHSQIWTFFQTAPFAPVTHTEGAWKVGDGGVLASDELLVPSDFEGTIDHPMGGLAAWVLNHRETINDWASGPWAALALRAYVYPQGSGLDWHVDDHGVYAGALVYYAHPVWNVAFGGELLVGGAPLAPEAGLRGHRFDNRHFSDQLLEQQTGHCILPKPNRLVLIGDHPHKVNAVHPNAGQVVRASVAGFFLREWPEELR